MQRRFLLLLISLLLLAGCGQMGPLYLPPHKAVKNTQQTPVAANTTAAQSN